MQRPDLSNTKPEVIAYIEYLEQQITEKSPKHKIINDEDNFGDDLPLPADELPTSMCVITLTASGRAKRTYRHLYSRQRRGGMGIFDIETDEDDPPILLTIADESQSLIALTNFGRAYRLQVSNLPETPVRGRGSPLLSKYLLDEKETVSTLLPIQAQGYLAVVSANGMVRALRHHFFGEHLKPGTAVYDFRAFGPLAAACWTIDDAYLFIATRSGKAIRFPVKTIPPGGAQALRMLDDDIAIAVTSVYDDSNVFMVGIDGKGVIRAMSGFNANKLHGAAGKVALNTRRLTGAQAIQADDDIFIISRLSKIIRFQSAEVPVKEGPVMGVNCMTFRADEAVAMWASSLIHT